jgi:DNA replication protein DnaC
MNAVPTTNSFNNLNQGMNSQVMMDQLKSMLLTMAMVKSTNQTDNQSSFINTIIFMIMVSFIDSIVIQIKRFLGIISTKFDTYLSNKTKDIAIINSITTMVTKTKKSSIIVKVEVASKNPTSDSIIDLLTHLPHTKCILLQNGVYTINYNEEIEISKGLYAQLVNSSVSQISKVTNNENAEKQSEDPSNTQIVTTSEDKEGGMPYGYIDIYSYTMDMEQLRNELNVIVKNYLIKMSNKLGNNIYYFSEMPLHVYRDSNGKIDHTKTPDCLHFTMKNFVTNRSFKNLFGKDIDVIRKRVEFFRDNKQWYDEKGIPYTLGILVSGSPGSGKTSLIKCIANELKRHIVNIHLSDSMTKTQLENLFYNEQIHITQNGKTETYTIPINKRIYVLEDIDCQSEIILDRGSETAEQVLARKNAELKEEIERLKFAITEMSNGRKMVVTGGNMPGHQENKNNENSSQKITLSFLLNLLDGVLETPGRITFMTTNFIDKLDKAFTRPGRVDIIRKFTFADHSQLIDIIQHRYDTKLNEDQLSIVYNLQQCITPAEIGRILFENFDNLDGALVGLASYADECMMKEKEKKDKEEELKTKISLLEMDAKEKMNDEKKETNNSVDTNPVDTNPVDTTSVDTIPIQEVNYDFKQVFRARRDDKRMMNQKMNNDFFQGAQEMLGAKNMNINNDFFQGAQEMLGANDINNGHFSGGSYMNGPMAYMN